MTSGMSTGPRGEFKIKSEPEDKYLTPDKHLAPAATTRLWLRTALFELKLEHFRNKALFGNNGFVEHTTLETEVIDLAIERDVTVLADTLTDKQVMLT